MLIVVVCIVVVCIVVVCIVVVCIVVVVVVCIFVHSRRLCRRTVATTKSFVLEVVLS